MKRYQKVDLKTYPDLKGKITSFLKFMEKEHGPKYHKDGSVVLDDSESIWYYIAKFHNPKLQS